MEARGPIAVLKIGTRLSVVFVGSTAPAPRPGRFSAGNTTLTRFPILDSKNPKTKPLSTHDYVHFWYLHWCMFERDMY